MAEPAINLEPEETNATKADTLVVKSQAKIETFKAQVKEIVTVKADGSFLATITTAEQFTLSDTVKKMVEEEKKAVLADIIESGVDCIPNAINYKKLAIICGTASFIGAFVAGIIVFILARFSH